MPAISIIQTLTDKLQAHKSRQFTGLVHIGIGKKAQWSLYFHMGRLVWAHSKLHAVRRWHRQIVQHCPQLLKGFEQDYAALHYSKLVTQVRDGNLNRISMAKAVEDYLSEILFDIIHQGTLRNLQAKSSFTFVDIEKRYDSSLFLIVRAEQAWQQTQYDWQAWQQAELVKCSPNLAPKIGSAEELKKRTSAAVYEHLSGIIDGEHNFRDLAVQLNQPLLPLTRRIVPYVRQGLMGLVRIDDLVIPASKSPATTSPSQASVQAQPLTQTKSHAHQASLATAQPLSSSSTAHSTAKGSRSNSTTSPAVLSKAQNTRSPANIKKAASNAPLIIYIDDSPMDSRAMGKILQDAGFRFRSIQESTHALPLLIEHKPQLIFLDLVMPVANGYEICSQVRRVSLFKNIPIVIVTSNNTFSDRVHAKMVGASGFLTKPINNEKVLKTVHKLLDKQASQISKGMTQAGIQTNIAKARNLRAIGTAQAKATGHHQVPPARI
ncbi:MAG: response regulator [Phormidesmis sp.]